MRYVRVALCFLLLVGASGVTAQDEPIHVIQWGENLFRIALRYGTSVGALTAANGIANPDRIYAGQRLRIPSGNVVQSAASPVQGVTSVPEAVPVSTTTGATNSEIHFFYPEPNARINHDAVWAIPFRWTTLACAASYGLRWTSTVTGASRLYSGLDEPVLTADIKDFTEGQVCVLGPYEYYAIVYDASGNEITRSDTQVFYMEGTPLEGSTSCEQVRATCDPCDAVRIWAENLSLERGQCTEVYWSAPGAVSVTLVHPDGAEESVSEWGMRTTCHNACCYESTEVWTLRATLSDGSVVNRSVSIELR